MGSSDTLTVCIGSDPITSDHLWNFSTRLVDNEYVIDAFMDRPMKLTSGAQLPSSITRIQMILLDVDQWLAQVFQGILSRSRLPEQ